MANFLKGPCATKCASWVSVDALANVFLPISLFVIARCAPSGVSSRVLDNEPDVLSHRILRGVDDEDEVLGCKFVVYAE